MKRRSFIRTVRKTRDQMLVGHTISKHRSQLLANIAASNLLMNHVVGIDMAHGYDRSVEIMIRRLPDGDVMIDSVREV